MAQSFDGDIRLSVGLDTKQVTDTINKLAKTVSNTFSNATGAVVNAERAMDNFDKKVDKTSKDMRQMDSNSGVEKFDKGITKASKGLWSLYGRFCDLFRVSQDVGNSTENMGAGVEKTDGIFKRLTQTVLKGYRAFEDLFRVERTGADTSTTDTMADSIERTKSAAKGLGSTMQSAMGEVVSANNKASKAELQHELRVSDLQHKIDTLRQKQAELAATQVPTDNYKNLQKDIDKAEKTLLSLLNKSEKYESAGKSVPAELTRQIDEADEHLKRLESDMEKLKASGKAFTPGTSTDAYKAVSYDLERAEKQMEILNAETQKAGGTARKTSSNIGNSFKSAFNKIRNAGSKMFGHVKGFFSKLKGKAKDSAGDMEKSFKRGFRNILKYALGIRSFYLLFRKIRTAAKAALTSMATQFPEVNAQLSELKNNFIQLKGSVGTVVQPLLQVLAPALNSIINLFTSAANAVANFLAVLTGQKYIYKANKGTTSFAKAQDASTDATKKNTKAIEENQKQLGHYDKLNIIDQDKDKNKSGAGGGAGGGAGEMTFTKVPVDSSIKDFIDRIKKAWKKGDLTEIGKIIGTKLRDALKKIPWNSIQKEAEKTGKRLGTLVAGFISVKGLAKSIGNTIGQALNTLLLGLQSFIKNVPWQKFGAFLADMLSSAFLAKDKNGTTLIGNIVKTLVAVINAVIDTFIGFVGKMKNKWGEIGDEISKWLQWAIENIKIGEFATAVGEFINGLVTLISKTLGKKETWVKAGKKIAEAINNLFHTIKWGELAKAISDTAMGFLSMIETALDEVDWDAIGKAIGDFLGNIDWIGILTKVVKIIVKTFWGLLKALFTPSGNVQGDIIKAILGALATIFVAKKFMGLVGTIKGCFGGIFGKGMTQAAGSVTTTNGITSGLSASVKGAIGKAALVTAVAALGLWIGKQLGDYLSEKDWFKNTVKGIGEWFGKDWSMMTEQEWEALKERAKAAKAEVEKELEPITKKIETANKSTESALKSIASFNKSLKNIDTGGKGIKNALDTFTKLSKKTHLTAVETEALKSASAKLAKKYPELSKYIDKNTGMLKINEKKLKSIIKESKRHAKAVEAQKNAEALYAKQAPLKKALEDALKAYDDAKRKADDYHKVWKETVDKWKKGLVDDATMAEVNKKMQGYSRAVQEAAGAVDKAKRAQKENNEAISKANNLMETAKIKSNNLKNKHNELKNALKQTNLKASEQKSILKKLDKALYDGEISWKQYKHIVDKTKKGAGELKAELGKLNNTKVKGSIKIETKGKDEMKRVQKYFEQFKGNKVTKKVVLDIQAKFKDPHVKAAFKSGHFSVSDYLQSWVKKAVGGVFTGSGWHNIEGYAKGGSPKSGQFFMARENGIPELVGTIRNHTAVMNNNQIVASVANGVYRAVAGVASVILPYVKSQTHAMNWLAQNGLQIPDLPDVVKGNVVPSNNQFLQLLAGQNTGMDNIALNTIADTLAGMIAQDDNKEPIIVQMPDGKVLAQAVWDEEEKKYKQTRSATLRTRFA